MAQLTYTYDASKIAEHGLDQMRFELGDTMVEGGTETCALSDQEYKAVIEAYPRWKRAKLACVESILPVFLRGEHQGWRTEPLPERPPGLLEKALF